MIHRTVDLERARAAAAAEQPKLEKARAEWLAQTGGADVADDDEREDDAPERDVGDEFPGREQLTICAQLLLFKLSAGAAARWGEHWLIEEKEAQAIAGPLLDVIELEFGAIANDPYSRLWLACGMFAAPRIFNGVFAPPTTAAAAPNTAAPTSSTMDTTAEVTKEEAA